MILAWNVQVLVVGLVVALAVSALGARTPGVRYALLAVLALKLVVPPYVTAPTGVWSVAGGRAAATGVGVAPRPLAPAWDGSGLPVPELAGARSGGAQPHRRPVAAAVPWLLALYLLGVAARGAALIREGRRLARLATAARPLDSDAAPRVRVAASDDVPAPIAFGVRRPTVLVPSSLAAGRAPSQAVLAHELGHLRHRDPLVNLVLAIVGALWWFHPAAWWLAREARRVQEDLVDDAVVGAGLDAETYCAALLDAARAAARRPDASALASGASAPAHALARRFRRVLTPESPRRRTTDMLLRLAPLTLAATLLPGATPPAQDPVSDGFSDERPPLERALAWLAEHQREDGRFFEGDAPAGDAADALALLAFLGAGHTANVGPHRLVVARGLARVEARFEGTRAGELALSDALGALFLAEASALSGQTSPALAGAIGRVTQGLADTGAEHLDPAVAFWSALALVSAGDVGIEVDGTALAAALGHVPLDGEAPSAAGWSVVHTTAAALFLHTLTGGDPNEPRVVAAIDRVAAAGAEGADALLLHLGSYALYQIGGEAWTGWRERTLPLLDAGQGEDGAWASAANVPGRRVGTTALRALGLEVLWRYARVLGDR